MDCLLPVDRRVKPWIGVGERISHDVRGGKRYAVETLRRFF
jgi:hypothetical protein